MSNTERVTSISCQVPTELAERLRDTARSECNGLSAVVRRLLASALAAEQRDQDRNEAAVTR